MWYSSAIYGQKYILTGRILMERHIVAKPAFNSSTLIIVAAGALGIVFFTALETIYIELTHVVADALKVLYQLAVRHQIHLHFQVMTTF